MTEAEGVVFVVDDDAAMRRSLQSLVRSIGLRVELFASAQDFLRCTPPSTPGCLVLDVRLPGLSGLDLQRRMAEANLDIPIVFITAHGDIPMTVRAMKGGAMEFLTKPFRTRRLLDAIRAAIERDRDTLKQRTEVAQLRNCHDLLTPREREVLALLVLGLLNKQIAGQLVTSERTIKFHRAHIMQKMRAESLADLVRMAQKLGLTGQA